MDKTEAQQRSHQIWEELAPKVWDKGVEQCMAVANQHINVPLTSAISDQGVELFMTTRTLLLIDIIQKFGIEHSQHSVAAVKEMEDGVLRELFDAMFIAGYEHGKAGGLVEKIKGICNCKEHGQN